MFNPFSEIRILKWQIESLSNRVLDLELKEKNDKSDCSHLHVTTGACVGCKHYVTWVQHLGVKTYDHYACRLNKQCSDREEQPYWSEIIHQKTLGEKVKTVEATPFDWDTSVTYTAHEGR